jgi:glucose repression regulatory protein TUP1
MTVRVWDIETGNLVERIRGHADSVYDIAFSPDGQGIVSASLDRTLKCWDIGPFLRSEYRDAALVQGQGGGGEGGEKGSVCTLNLRGHRVCSSFVIGALYGSLQRFPASFQDYVLSSAISPDGAWVVSGSKDRSIQFWNPASGGLAQVIIQSHKNSGEDRTSVFH